MSTLIDRLHDDHVNMRDLLNVLSDLVGRLRRDDADVDYHLMLEIFDYFISFPDAVHHPVEDRLFTRVLANAPELRADVAALKAEHEAAADAAREICESLHGICAGHVVVRQRLIEMIEAFVSSQMQHMETEEERILRVARDLIPEEEWVVFEDLYKKQIDPLFGATVRDTFKRLHDCVMESVSG
jgi:hemerythrin-like domain-containing protein